MNISESNDVATVLRWLTGITYPGANDTSARAREAAVRLGERAHKTLMSGLTSDEIRQHWPAARSAEAARVQILQLEEAVLASAGLVFDEVPAQPRGLKDHYTVALSEMAEDIKARHEEARRG